MKTKYFLVYVIGYIMGWEIVNGYYFAATCGLILSFYVWYSVKYG